MKIYGENFQCGKNDFQDQRSEFDCLQSDTFVMKNLHVRFIRTYCFID